MDCIISIKGDGEGRYGKPKNDRSGPVWDFLVDNQIFYRLVKNHIAKCDKCDPNEALEIYLRRRLDPQTWKTKKKPHALVPVFPVSAGLAKLSLQYDRIFAKRLRPGLVRQFLKLSASHDFIDHIAHFSEEDILERMKKYYEDADVKKQAGESPDWRIQQVQNYLMRVIHPKVDFMSSLFKLSPEVVKVVSSVEEARKLILTAEVMCS